MSITSYNEKARNILTSLRILDSFDIVVGFLDFTETKHLTIIRDFYNTKFENMHLFDDNFNNISEMKLLGVNVKLISLGLKEIDVF